MGLRPDPDALRAAFAAALSLAADHDVRLPTDIAEVTRRLDRSKSKTFTPVLGTALLARAAEPRIDPLALKITAGARGYAAPSVARVFFSETRLAGIDAKCSTPAFLNNQPFLSRERVSKRAMKTCRDQASLSVLIGALKAVDSMNQSRATSALAAFLRTRKALTQAPARTSYPPGTLPLDSALRVCAKFVAARSDGGRRGQAMLLACMSLGAGSAVSAKVNDPSFDLPGDVVLYEADRGDEGAIIAVGEAKQKVVQLADVMAAAEAAAADNIGALVYAALAAGQPLLDVAATLAERHGVAVEFHCTTETLLTTSLTRSSRGAAEALAQLPQLMREALLALEAPADSLAEWDGLVTGALE